MRGGLIALALLFGILSGLPQPERRIVDKMPWVAREAVDIYLATASAILRPVRFVPELFQFSQEWRLFSSAADARFWMAIEGRQGRNDEWRLLYRPHDSEHTWMAEEIEYRRLRGNWNPSRRGPNRGYDAFVTWIARRAFADYPELRTVRVRMQEIRLLALGKGFEPTGRFLHESARERGEVSP